MLLKLAWRNIWRNKRRSQIVFGSIVVGIIATLFMNGFMNGMVYQMLDNQISSNISHIQIHKKGFNDNKIVQSFIPNYDLVEKELKRNPGVKSYSKRVITFGLISSARNSAGVYINGIIPEMEKDVSNIKESMISGSYLTGKKQEIIIGKKLAEKLEVDIGDKIVVMSNTPDGTIGSEMFRIVGLFKTVSSSFDKSYIYIPITSAQSMLDIKNNIFEFAIITNDPQNVELTKSSILKNLNDDYEVLSYNDLLPLLIFQIETTKQSMWIFYIIIALALIFGIVNSMLMSVFERIQELGVLMSIGMKNRKIFFMIIWEAFILGLFGTIVGVVLGYLIVLPFQYWGLDFSIYSESLESFGLGAIIYPSISIEELISLLILIPFISIIAAIYPAIKAIKLEPINAMRYV